MGVLIFQALATVTAITTVVLAFYSLLHPSWFRQDYREDTYRLYQGFGLFYFYASGSDPNNNPFVNEDTSLSYGTICGFTDTFPALFLGAGFEIQDAVCNTWFVVSQILSVVGAFAALMILIATLAVVFNWRSAQAESNISPLSLLGSLSFSAVLLLWGVKVHPDLFEIEAINNAYQTCENSSLNWACWFYGRAFWVTLGVIVGMTISGYFTGKIVSRRREAARNAEHDVYQDQLVNAIEQSHLEEQGRQSQIIERSSEYSTLSEMHPIQEDNEDHIVMTEIPETKNGVMV